MVDGSPETGALNIGVVISAIVVLLLIGTYAYYALEGWSVIDCFYFSATTLTTVGYGDLHPTHNATKIFTAVFAIFGVGVMLTSATYLAHKYLLGQHVLFHRRIVKTTNRVTHKVEKSMKRLDHLRKDKNIMGKIIPRK
ncbi:MAG: potassium channel family protein [Nanoarchaeota archaeon]